MSEPPTPGSWGSVDWREVASTVAASAAVGAIRLGYLIKLGRRWTWFDVVVEPSLAVMAGVLAWALTEYQSIPDLPQSVCTSIAAWAGPRFMAALEANYISKIIGVEPHNTRPGDLDPPHKG